ncbi:MAG: hypothetical protein IJM15_04185 [Erysipelotrichaceae bacterium]|nr:hypothetical protein [Erysipelotrichaceae bacterium]
MDFKELINKLTTSPYFYAGLVAVAVILVFIVVRAARKSNLTKQLEKLNIKYKSLDSQPFNIRLTQSQALARTNQEIRDIVEQCEDDFEKVITNKKEILTQLTDIDEDLSFHKYALAKENLANAETLLNQTEEIGNSLNKKLQTILEKSAIYLNKVNDLQIQFHDIKQRVNKDPELYFICWEALEKKSAAISHLFSSMNLATNSNKYEEAENIGSQIEQSIKEFDHIVRDLPELVSVAKSQIPARMTEVRNAYTLLKQQGAYLEHLDVEKNLQFITDSLDGDIKAIENCDIDSVNDHLYNYQTRMNQLLQQIGSEEDDYRHVFDLFTDVDEMVKQAIEKVKFISANSENVNARFGLSAGKEQSAHIMDSTKQLAFAYSQMVDTIKARSVPASTMVLSLNKLKNDAQETLDEINEIYNQFNSVQLEERRAREQLDRYSVVLNEIQVSIRMNRLPKLSKQFEQDIETANTKIAAIQNMLNQVPIDIELLKSREKDLSDFVISLHEKINGIIMMTGEIEKYVVIANRYRPFYTEVDNELTRAELAYRNGDYSLSYQISLKIMEKYASQYLPEKQPANG